jgi:RNA-binding protein YhbY
MILSQNIEIKQRVAEEGILKVKFLVYCFKESSAVSSKIRQDLKLSHCP